MNRPVGFNFRSTSRSGGRGWWLLILGAAFLGPAAPSDLAAHPSHQTGSNILCVCDSLREGTGWCDACGRGFLAGVEIDSPVLFEVLDPHGHEMDPERMPCNLCREARETNGFCEAHGIGFVEGQGYMTRLTYLLARAGAPSPPGDLETRTEVEWARLRVALWHLDRCELCVVACFTSGRCPECNLYYRNGEAVPAETPKRTLR